MTKGFAGGMFDFWKLIFISECPKCHLRSLLLSVLFFALPMHIGEVAGMPARHPREP